MLAITFWRLVYGYAKIVSALGAVSSAKIRPSGVFPQREPDPYSEQERETILSYYCSNRPRWAYAFVYFRFWTGTRPSEATALKWGNIDLQSGKAMLSLSRHLGEENATKTRASRRTIALLPNVVDVLKSILPLRVEPTGYVFTDGQGKPHRSI
jgi:integrase